MCIHTDDTYTDDTYTDDTYTDDTYTDDTYTRMRTLVYTLVQRRSLTLHPFARARDLRSSAGWRGYAHEPAFSFTGEGEGLRFKSSAFRSPSTCMRWIDAHQ
jgi:hypothetical protein